MKTIEVKIEDLAPLWLEKSERPTGTFRKRGDKGMQGIGQFQNRSILRFVEDDIVPAIESISEERLFPYMGVVNDLLSILENNPQASSVGDMETDEHYQVLKPVTLLEHSLNVARILMAKGAAMKSGGDMALKLAVLGLGHDIGKIVGPKRHPSHAMKSYLFLEKALSGDSVGKKILEAIKLHHQIDGVRKNDFLELLIEADTLEREQALNAMVKGSCAGTGKPQQGKLFSKPSPMDGAGPRIDPRQLMNRIRQRIDSIGFEAFSFEGNTYIAPTVLREIISELEGRSKTAVQIELVKSRIASVMNHGVRIMNGQFRLKYTRREFRPDKKYFFVISNEDLDIDKQPDPPRDESGRWLKRVDEVKILKD